MHEGLGDLLFQVAYYSQLVREEDRFTLGGMADGITHRPIRRHPRVFLDGNLYDKPDAAKLAGAAAKRCWEELKAEECAAKVKKPQQLSLLDDAPAVLPALPWTAKLWERATQVGFDWPEVLLVVDEVRKELNEALETMAEGDEGAMGGEVGDLPLVVVNLARHLEVDLEAVLRQADGKSRR